MKTLKEKIEVMQSALDGKEIEVIRNDVKNDEGGWFTLSDNDDADWNWGFQDYRIKPEPLEFWVNYHTNKNEIFVDKEAAEFAADGIETYIKTIKVRQVED